MTFPKNLVWGTAAASYQIEGAWNEGGRKPSIWDVFSETHGKALNGDTGKIACDHYHRYKEDVALMKEIGISAYGLSTAWPRVIPVARGRKTRRG